jgi:hypothetical protein
LEEEAPSLVPAFEELGMDSTETLAWEHDWNSHFALVLNSVIDRYMAQSENPNIQEYERQARVRSSQSIHAVEDYAGVEKAGGWGDDSFAFQAGMMFTLAALEEFERSVIRVLTLAKHSGKDYTGANEPHRPRLEEYEEGNPEWEEVERQTRNQARRIKVLGDFGIAKPNAPWRDRLDEVWKNRNQFAHGSAPAKVTLEDYLNTHFDAFAAMIWLSEQCMTVHNISV